MKLCSKDLYDLKIIDEIISEPVGGAHRDRDLIINNLRNSIRTNLDFFKNMSQEEILNQRKNRFLSIGRSKGFASDADLSDNLSMKTNILDKFLNIYSNRKNYLIISVVITLLISTLIFFL